MYCTPLNTSNFTHRPIDLQCNIGKPRAGPSVIPILQVSQDLASPPRLRRSIVWSRTHRIWGPLCISIYNKDRAGFFFSDLHWPSYCAMAYEIGLSTPEVPNRGFPLWLCSVLMVIIAGIFVLFRLAIRYHHRRLGSDDWMILASLVRLSPFIVISIS